MCGIAGWIAPDPLPVEALCGMLGTIAHRGPDGSGTHVEGVDPQVALGHRRLAIIDLGGGGQPMHGPDGTTVVFNGEIYNYRELRRELTASGAVFRTDSDTEVLLHGWLRWGPDMVRRLDGMFAFALWHGPRRRLLLARDRFGKKPLMLARHGNALLFASEIKAIRAVPGFQARLNLDALAQHLRFRYVPGPQTLFDGVLKLPPGHFALWQDGHVRLERYFQPPDALPRSPERVPGDVQGRFLALLEQAVEKRLIADVPIGAFLSGGLDSSTVVALMRRLGAGPVSTFSVGFAERKYSELPFAALVAKELGCRHHEVPFTAAELMDLLPAATRFRDAPVSETADLPILKLSRLAAQEVKVVLTGEGADEILGGYPKHAFEGIGALFRRLTPPALDGAVMRPLARRLPYGMARLATLTECLATRDFGERMARWFGAGMPTGQLRSLPEASLRVNLAGDDPRNSPLRRILHFDQTVWLPDNLLERGDRMTMAAGLEGRMPFMDAGLAGFVSGLPDRYRLRGLTGKWLLRKVARGILPDSIIDRPKSGFRMPVNLWFRNEMRSMTADLLATPSARSAALYRPGAVEAVLAEHNGGRRNHEKTLWMMLALEVFLREHRLSVG